MLEAMEGVEVMLEGVLCLGVMKDMRRALKVLEVVLMAIEVILYMLEAVNVV